MDLPVHGRALPCMDKDVAPTSAIEAPGPAAGSADGDSGADASATVTGDPASTAGGTSEYFEVPGGTKRTVDDPPATMGTVLTAAAASVAPAAKRARLEQLLLDSADALAEVPGTSHIRHSATHPKVSRNIARSCSSPIQKRAKPHIPCSARSPTLTAACAHAFGAGCRLWWASSCTLTRQATNGPSAPLPS